MLQVFVTGLELVDQFLAQRRLAQPDFASGDLIDGQLRAVVDDEALEQLVGSLQVFLEFFANGMDVEKAKAAYKKLTPTPYHPYVQKVDLKKFYALELPMSYIFCKQDKALPDGWWHPKMSSRLKNHTYAEIDTCHEVMFSEPEACAEKIIQMAG